MQHLSFCKIQTRAWIAFSSNGSRVWRRARCYSSCHYGRSDWAQRQEPMFPSLALRKICIANNSLAIIWSRGPGSIADRPQNLLALSSLLKVVSDDHCPIGVYGTLSEYTVDLQLLTCHISNQCIFLSFACPVWRQQFFIFYYQCNNQCTKFFHFGGKWISLKSLTFLYGHLPLGTLLILVFGYKRRDIYHWKVNSCQLSRHHWALQAGIVIGWHVM